jgi:cell division protein ZapA
MSEKKSTASVEATIAGRTFALACGPDERADLEAALALVSERVDEAYEQSNSANSERLLLLAALNLAHDLRRMRGLSRTAGAASTAVAGASADALAALKKKIDAALG